MLRKVQGQHCTCRPCQNCISLQPGSCHKKFHWYLVWCGQRRATSGPYVGQEIESAVFAVPEQCPVVASTFIGRNSVQVDVGALDECRLRVTSVNIALKCVGSRDGSCGADLKKGSAVELPSARKCRTVKISVTRLRKSDWRLPPEPQGKSYDQNKVPSVVNSKRVP